jgi:hypothetical protein
MQKAMPDILHITGALSATEKTENAHFAMEPDRYRFADVHVG